MHTPSNLFDIAYRAALFSFLVAATALLAQAQDRAPASAPFVAPYAAPTSLDLSSSSSPSTPVLAADSNSEPRLDLAASFGFDRLQPPPRRYGRPRFSSKTSNPDGSAKYEFLGGIGAALPIGDTLTYERPNWGLEAGGGRNFNRNFGIILQFDYDHFGLQASTLNNQTYIYSVLLGCTPSQISAGSCVTGLDGNNHVWSFTLNPTFTLSTKGPWDAYAVAGGGFYHKVTNFTQPTTQETCSIYGCGYFSVSENIDHYTSNAVGISGGMGFTRKLSQFSNLRLYLEARYVFVFNQQRNGVTAANVGTAPANSTNFYPANSHRTTYIPIKLGLRF